jgi:hypothetical protein
MDGLPRRGCGGGDQTRQHGLMTGELLDAVHLERILDMPIAFVLAAPIAVVSMLNDGRI